MIHCLVMMIILIWFGSVQFSSVQFCSVLYWLIKLTSRQPSNTSASLIYWQLSWLVDSLESWWPSTTYQSNKHINWSDIIWCSGRHWCTQCFKWVSCPNISIYSNIGSCLILQLSLRQCWSTYTHTTAVICERISGAALPPPQCLHCHTSLHRCLLSSHRQVEAYSVWSSIYKSIHWWPSFLFAFELTYDKTTNEHSTYRVKLISS